MGPQTFDLTIEGSPIPPIDVETYAHKHYGSFGAYMPSGADQWISRVNLAEFRKTIEGMLKRTHGGRAPTRHIAVISFSFGIEDRSYHLRFWPLLRRETLTAVWWADVTAYGYESRGADEIDWDCLREWSECEPGKYIHGLRYAKILDWSPETWGSLWTVRHSLDDGMDKIGELVTSPVMLAEHAQKLLKA